MTEQGPVKRDDKLLAMQMKNGPVAFAYRSYNTDPPLTLLVGQAGTVLLTYEDAQGRLSVLETRNELIARGFADALRCALIQGVLLRHRDPKAAQELVEEFGWVQEKSFVTGWLNEGHKKP